MGDPSEAEALPSSVDADPIDDAMGQLAEQGLSARLEDRVIRLTGPVPGSPHLAVLQALGFAAKASPVGAAAHGPAGVAAAVWQTPLLYMVRWTGPSRWVSAFKFPARGRPDDYLRDESGIPSHMGRGSWYGPVPDEVAEAFFSVGLLLDEPPFPVPVVATPPPAPAATTATRSSPRAPAAPRPPRAPAAPRAPRKRAEPAPPKQVVPTTRTCSMCNLQKHLSQFVAGSDLCVDCR